MKKSKSTHTGVVVGMDARTPLGWCKQVTLRETVRFWVVTEQRLGVAVVGTRYRKTDGLPPREDWPMYKLDIETVSKCKG